VDDDFDDFAIIRSTAVGGGNLDRLIRVKPARDLVLVQILAVGLAWTGNGRVQHRDVARAPWAVVRSRCAVPASRWIARR
jgi:hypothetical protein